MDLILSDGAQEDKDIPHGWMKKKLGDCFSFLTTANYPRSDLSPYGEVMYLHYGDIHTRKSMFLDLQRDSLPYIAHEKVRKIPRLEDGDLVIADASEDYEGIGKAIEVRNASSMKVVAGLHTLLLRAKKGEFADGFKAYIQFIPSIKGSLIKAATGISVYGISKGNLADIDAVLPGLDEQKKIVHCLTDVEALIENLEALITKKKNIKQAAIQELFCPNAGWLEKKLGNTCILKGRIGWQGLTTAEYLDSGDYRLVTGTDFLNGYIDWNHCHYVDESRYVQDKNIQLKKNDILVTKDGTIGKVAIVDKLEKPATLNSGVFVIRPIDDAFHPGFMYHLLRSHIFSIFLDQLCAGSTINHLYQKDFVNFTYPVPVTLLEQVSIANSLSSMDEEIIALEAELEKIILIKKGILHELLTGRIRLK